MYKSDQAYCICGKPITMKNDGNDNILEIIGKKNDIQLFHSIDCALIYKRLEGTYGNSNVFTN
ncbi:MAG: hypothetical protein WBP64_14530 [Nitrososphaeraceae archaeon]